MNGFGRRAEKDRRRRLRAKKTMVREEKMEMRGRDENVNAEKKGRGEKKRIGKRNEGLGAKRTMLRKEEEGMKGSLNIDIRIRRREKQNKDEEMEDENVEWRLDLDERDECLKNAKERKENRAKTKMSVREDVVMR